MDRLRRGVRGLAGGFLYRLCSRWVEKAADADFAVLTRRRPTAITSDANDIIFDGCWALCMRHTESSPILDLIFILWFICLCDFSCFCVCAMFFLCALPLCWWRWFSPTRSSMRLIPGYVCRIDLKIRTVCVRGSGYGVSKVTIGRNRRNRHVVSEGLSHQPNVRIG